MSNIKRGELGNALMAVVIATFIAGIGSGAISESDVYAEDNYDIPVLSISKTMFSGSASVPALIKASWKLKIEVTYTDETPLTNVIVEDTLPEEIDYDAMVVSKGKLKVKKRGKGPVIEWNIGTMNPGDVEMLLLQVSTGRTKNQQNFLTAGTYELNGGATVTGWHSGTSTMITAGPTSQITVTAY